jgi:DNA-binding transcriptional MocR family regulator
VPDGGYFVWLVLPKAIQTHKIYQQLLRSDVSVAYGDLFSTSDQFGHCLRLNVSYELTLEVEQALKQLAKLIENELFGDFSA